MTSRRLGTVLGAVVLGVVATSCSGADDEPRDRPPVSTVDQTEPSPPSTGPTTGPATGPTGSIEAEPEPVSGTPVELDGLSFVLPEPYRAFDESPVGVLANRGPGDPVALIEVTTLPSVGDMSLAEARQVHLDGNFYEQAPASLEPVPVDGVAMFHLAGQTNDITWTEAFGTDETGSAIDITLEFRVSVPEAERQEVVDAVLASIELAE